MRSDQKVFPDDTEKCIARVSDDTGKYEVQSKTNANFVIASVPVVRI